MRSPKRSKSSPPITLVQLSARLDALEQRIAQAGSNGVSLRWWEQAGRFKDDPDFDEIVRLGRQQRNARPRRSGVKKRARS